MNNLTVTNPVTHKYQTVPLSPEELGNIDRLSAAKTLCPMRAALVPVRTDRNLPKDLFLPTVVNHAMKIDNVAARIFAVIGALVFDIITLPVRIMTAPFRAALSKKKENGELYKYLIDKGVDKKILNADEVQLKLDWTGNAKNTLTYHADGTVAEPIMQHSKTLNAPFVVVPCSYDRKLHVEDPKKVDETIVDAPENDDERAKELSNIFSCVQVDKSDGIYANAKEMKVVITANVGGKKILKEKVLKTDEGKFLDIDEMGKALTNCKIKADDALKADKNGSNISLSLTIMTIREEDGERKYGYVNSCYECGPISSGKIFSGVHAAAENFNGEGLSMYPYGSETPTQHLDENGGFLVR